MSLKYAAIGQELKWLTQYRLDLGNTRDEIVNALLMGAFCVYDGKTKTTREQNDTIILALRRTLEEEVDKVKK